MHDKINPIIQVTINLLQVRIHTTLVPAEVSSFGLCKFVGDIGFICGQHKVYKSKMTDQELEWRECHVLIMYCIVSLFGPEFLQISISCIL